MDFRSLHIRYLFIVILLQFIGNLNTLHAQRANNWYFGDHAGMQFTNNGVVPLTNSNMGLVTYGTSYCTSMSDADGNLLFYSNGENIWNRNHQIMANGANLSITGTAIARSIGQMGAVPLPNNDSMYMFFYIKTIASGFGWGLHYSIINMHSLGGDGEVVTKNIYVPLPTGNGTSNGLAIIQHANGKNYWLTIKDFNLGLFYSYQITENGISSQPIISDLSGFTNLTLQSYLHPSPNGELIYCFTNSGSACILNFNTVTGVIENQKNLNGTLGWGCFSPDSKRLYTIFTDYNNAGQSYLRQFSITDTALISTQVIYTNIISIPYSQTSDNSFRDMQIGPDNKIYVARYNSTRLSCIQNPNDSATACNFLDTAIILTTGKCYSALPGFYNTINGRFLTLNIKPVNCSSFSFSFGSNSKGATVKQWQLSDGFTSADSTFVHTLPPNTDSILATLTLIANDTTLTRQQWVYLPKKPAASFAYQTSGCIKEAVKFVGTATQLNTAPINNIQWLLGDGSSLANVQAFGHTYADTGHYTVKLWAADTLGCTSDTAIHTIAVNKKVVGGFYTVGSFCNNAAFELHDTSRAFNTTTNQYKYYFSNGDSLANSITGNQHYHFATAGNYTIKQINASIDGCLSDTATQNITVYQKPTAAFALPENCVLDPSKFFDSSTAPAGSAINNWHWNFGDANANAGNADTSIVQHATHQYTQAANYNVQLIVNTNNQCRDTLTKSLTINGSIPNAALAMAPTNFCSGDSVRFIDNSTVNFGSITQLEWTWNGTDILSVSHPAAGAVYAKKYPAFATPATKNFPVRLKVQSGTNCMAVKDTFVTIKAQPKVQFAHLADICANNGARHIVEAAEVSGAAGSGWYTGSGITDTASGLFDPRLLAANNNYKILYTYKTALGCMDTASQRINILDTPFADAGTDKVVLEGGKVLLTASAAGSSLSFAWQPAATLSNASLLQPFASPVASTTYLLTATQANGCWASDTVNVRVLKSLNVPNAFSPNGDGINDFWEIAYLNSYANARVWVYNRAGQTVFESFGYSRAWDGKCNGKELPIGTYYYIVNPGNGRGVYTGTVTLMK